MKNIKDVCFIVQARLNSDRVPRKMLKSFANSTLLDICLSKLLRSSVIPKDNIFLSCYEPEIKACGIRHGINIFPRSKQSANEETKMGVIYEWHNKLNIMFKKDYKYVVLISACNPLLSISTIDNFVKEFLFSTKKGAFGVFLNRNYFWSKSGKPITNWKKLPIMNTKIVDPVYEAAHCLYATPIEIIKDGFFMDDKSPADPHLFCMEELESFDIDYPWQFDVAEILYEKFKENTFKPSNVLISKPAKPKCYSNPTPKPKPSKPKCYSNPTPKPKPSKPKCYSNPTPKPKPTPDPEPKHPKSYYGNNKLTKEQFKEINSGPSVFTKNELAASGSINPNKPIWVLGPSSELSKYKDFIVNDLKKENTMALGHVFYNLISNWDFTCYFITWYDPHQLKGFIDNFDFIKNKIRHKKKVNLVTPSFNKNHYFFPSVSSFWNDESYQKKYNKLMSDVESDELFNLIYPKTMFLPWIDLGLNNHEIDQELSQKLYNDPNFRFNQYDHCVFQTLLQKDKSINYNKALTDPKAGYLENALTFTILPILHFLGFKKVFILGFDGNQGRMVGQDHINPLHSKFNGIDEWLKWKPFHNMEIVNLQKNSPLAKKIPYTSIENKNRKR